MISVYGGVAWLNIAYHEQLVAAPSQQVTSALIVGKVSLFRFDRTNLDVVATVLPALSDLGRIHTNVNVAYYIKLWSKFTWNISFYGNWDNQPHPAFPAATTAQVPGSPTDLATVSTSPTVQRFLTVWRLCDPPPKNSSRPGRYLDQYINTIGMPFRSA